MRSAGVVRRPVASEVTRGKNATRKVTTSPRHLARAEHHHQDGREGDLGHRLGQDQERVDCVRHQRRGSDQHREGNAYRDGERESPHHTVPRVARVWLATRPKLVRYSLAMTLSAGSM